MHKSIKTNLIHNFP